VIGTSFGVPELRNGVHFPQSLPGCYSFLDLNATPYKEYVVCPACHMLYDPNTQTLILGTSRRQVSAKCSFVGFPNHPQRRFRLPCDNILLNQVQKKNEITFKLRKIYYYYGVKAALSILLNHPNFEVMQPLATEKGMQ